MRILAHHAGEELVLTAVAGSGLFSAALLIARARLAEIVRRHREQR